jgi:suppressor of G2 allele of SKP1
MAQAARGAAALTSSEFPTAVAAYTQALLEHPTSPDYYVQRSIAFTRVKPARHDLALKDAECAVLFAQKRAKREKIYAAQLRRAIALHGLGRYGDAQFVLALVEKFRPGDKPSAKMEEDMWKARVESKLKTASDAEKQVTVKEIPAVELPGEKQMLDQLKAQLNPDGSFKFEDASTDASAATSTATTANGTTNDTTNATDKASVQGAASTTLPKLRHEWYQNADHVILTVYARGVAKDAADIEIHDDSVHISFPHPSNPHSTFDFNLDPLYALVDAAASKFAVMSTKVEVTLKKAQVGQKWHGLEGNTPLKPTDKEKGDDEVKSAVMSTLTSRPAQSAAAPAYPTSSRHGPKDWDKLADDLARSKAKREAKDGSDDDNDDDDDAGVESDDELSGDAVDGFFKKLYKSSDEDTRRAMMKSFYESKGTSLSTNWAEVGKGKVEEVKGKDD